MEEGARISEIMVKIFSTVQLIYVFHFLTFSSPLLPFIFRWKKDFSPSFPHRFFFYLSLLAMWNLGFSINSLPFSCWTAPFCTLYSRLIFAHLHRHLILILIQTYNINSKITSPTLLIIQPQLFLKFSISFHHTNNTIWRRHHYQKKIK